MNILKQIYLFLSVNFYSNLFYHGQIAAHYAWQTKKRKYKYLYPLKNGATERSRTADLLITNQLLYQLSYGGFLDHYFQSRFCIESQLLLARFFELCSGRNIVKKFIVLDIIGIFAQT